MSAPLTSRAAHASGHAATLIAVAATLVSVAATVLWAVHLFEVDDLFDRSGRRVDLALLVGTIVFAAATVFGVFAVSRVVAHRPLRRRGMSALVAVLCLAVVGIAVRPVGETTGVQRVETLPAPTSKP